MNKATEEMFVNWRSSPGAAVDAMLGGRVGVIEGTPPLRRPVTRLLEEAAVGLCTVFATRAHRPSPGRGPGREPAMDGDEGKVTEEGGMRRGRSVRGEHRCDVG